MTVNHEIKLMKIAQCMKVKSLFIFTIKFVKGNGMTIWWTGKLQDWNHATALKLKIRINLGQIPLIEMVKQ